MPTPKNRPKYQELRELLVQRIEQGEWRPGERLPSEHQIAEEYNFAYMTVRQAVRELVMAGRLRRIRGRGTFVVETDEPDRKPSIGLLLIPNWHNMDPFYFPPLVSGFVERAEELGYRVHLADRSEPLLEFLRFQELRVSAVACVLLDHADMVDADALLDKGVLVVAINHYGGARRISAVKADNQAGSYAAARYLLDIGHRRLAYLAGPRYNLDAGERRRGVQKAISDAGLPDHALTVYEGGFLEDSGYERGKEIVRRRRLPTAVISVSDLAAIGLLKAFREEGVRVPEDVSVCGFGDFRLAAYTAPTLTTVRLPIEELGRRSASALIDLYQGYRPEVHVVDCPLVLRDSTAAPRAADALDNTASTARSRAARQGRRFGARL